MKTCEFTKDPECSVSIIGPHIFQIKFFMLIILSIAGIGVDIDANAIVHKDFEPIVKTNSFIMASLIFIYLLF